MRTHGVERSWVRRQVDGEIAALLGVAGGDARSVPYLGIKALMLAMLEDAIRTYLSDDPRGSHEAAEWIASRRRWVFSFATVCETLGVEPSAARNALRQMRVQSRDVRTLSFSRSRPNARQANLRVVPPRIRRRRSGVPRQLVCLDAPVVTPAADR